MVPTKAALTVFAAGALTAAGVVFAAQSDAATTPAAAASCGVFYDDFSYNSRTDAAFFPQTDSSNSLVSAIRSVADFQAPASVDGNARASPSSSSLVAAPFCGAGGAGAALVDGVEVVDWAAAIGAYSASNATIVRTCVRMTLPRRVARAAGGQKPWGAPRDRGR